MTMYRTIAGDIDDSLRLAPTSHKPNQVVNYLDIPCSFDIETSSFTIDGQKQAIMYTWQMMIDRYYFTGRRWEDFRTLLGQITRVLNLNEHRRLIIYVHNLGFEFQFMRGWFSWEHVFARSPREPIIADMADFPITFKCSYALTNKSLANVAKGLRDQSLSKKMGDLDYRLVRHSKTYLTTLEEGYCKADVEIVTQLIREKIEEEGDIANIPLTSTGYVRRHVRSVCRNKDNRKTYMPFVHDLLLTLDDYLACKRAFMGGFCHANSWKVGKVVENVGSFDLTSAYPATFCQYFPVSSFKKVNNVTKEMLDDLVKKYCCIIDFKFNNIRSGVIWEHILSSSKCWDLKDPMIDNGRVVTARSLCCTLTEIDYEIISWFYNWDSMEIGEVRIANRGDLPKPIVDSMLEFYNQKQALKHDPDKRVEYAYYKSLLNSCYGMMVTDILNNDWEYKNGEWVEPVVDMNKQVWDVNNDNNRFLYYPWGLWVTAHTRRRVLYMIRWIVKDDYIYADTDSIKCEKPIKYEELFKKDNKEIVEKWREITGSEIDLGKWEFEGVYEKFKTLGAKRYLTYSDGKYRLTVAGVGKNDATEYLSHFDDPFSIFDFGLNIPAENTGKLTHTYIDFPMSGEVVDYQGNKGEYHERSGIHLEPAEYSFDASVEFMKWLNRLVSQVR